MPGPCAYSTSCVRQKLVCCSRVCHGLKAHLCILPLILDLLWRELFSDFPFFIGLLLSRVGPCLIVGFLLFSSFFAPSVIFCHSCYITLKFLSWCLPMLAELLLGLLPILLLMTQHGHCHWIYTHATLNFLDPLHCLWASLSISFFLGILDPFAFLRYPWPIF